MKLVINIPDYIKEQADDGKVEEFGIPLWLAYEIANAKPLHEPFDLDGLKKDMKALNCGFPYGLDYLLNCLEQRLGITMADVNEVIANDRK